MNNKPTTGQGSTSYNYTSLPVAFEWKRCNILRLYQSHASNSHLKILGIFPIPTYLVCLNCLKCNYGLLECELKMVVYKHALIQPFSLSENPSVSLTCCHSLSVSLLFPPSWPLVHSTPPSCWQSLAHTDTSTHRSMRRSTPILFIISTLSLYLHIYWVYL